MFSERAVPGAVVFLGTSEFAVPSLQALVASGERISLVITQPDRPRGRGRRPEPSPVKTAAAAVCLPAFQPEDVNAPDAWEAVKVLAPEFLVVVAYGQILKRPMLELPRRGAVNLHASLLPRHRGPSPIAWTIWQGDAEAGNTTMLMEEGLDSGPTLLQAGFPLAPSLTRGDLEAELAREGSSLVVETLRRVRDGQLTPVPQETARATWSRLLTRDMRTIDWRGAAPQVLRQIHALSPSPAALVRVRGRLVRILRAEAIGGAGGDVPGRVLEIHRDGPVVLCGDGVLLLREVQPEGKRPMSGGDFARGGGVVPGDLLEPPGDV